MRVDHSFLERPYAWRMDYFARCCAWWLDQWERFPETMPKLEQAQVRLTSAPRALKDFYSPDTV